MYLQNDSMSIHGDYYRYESNAPQYNKMSTSSSSSANITSNNFEFAKQSVDNNNSRSTMNTAMGGDGGTRNQYLYQRQSNLQMTSPIVVDATLPLEQSSHPDRARNNHEFYFEKVVW